MNWFAALCAGFGLGLAYYRWLWWSVSRLPARRDRTYALSGFARLLVAGAAFYVFMIWGGILAVITGLCGMVLARWQLVRIVRGHK